MNFGPQEEETMMKRYIVSLLVKQAQSDSEFSNLEKKYLAYVARSLDLSGKEVAAVRRNPESYSIAPPPDESKRMTILYYMLFMMRADRNIRKEEEGLCYNIGFRLGFRQDMISDLVNVMWECLDREIPPDAMISRVKAYLN